LQTFLKTENNCYSFYFTAKDNNGWCPSNSDMSPWATIELTKPKALGALLFQYTERQEGEEKMYMEEFELQYISPLDSSKTFRTFAGVCNHNLSLLE